MTPNVRAIVAASTGAILITFLTRFHHPVTDLLDTPGRTALRAFRMSVGMSAGREAIPVLLSLMTAANLITWFVVIFTVARWLEDVLSRMPVMTMICFLILRTMAVVLLAMAIWFVVYMFVAPDGGHAKLEILMATFCLTAAAVPAAAAFVLHRMTRT